MKTVTFTYSPPHLINTAPLATRYEVMLASIFAFIAAGRHEEVLTYSRKVLSLVRVFTRFEAQNILTRRKLDMLSHKPWRDRVLRELGGMRKLGLWEAAHKRLQERAGRAPKVKTPNPAKLLDPSWLYTPDRIAESERLKARVRDYAKACAPERVVRDRVKMDFEGEFRLAPLPRGERAPRRRKVYTAASLTEYDYNPLPFAPQSGFGPATVWPAEFRAAMMVEARMEDTEIEDIETEEVEEKKDTLPIVSVYDAISPKLREDIFGGLALIPKAVQETPHAFS